MAGASMTIEYGTKADCWFFYHQLRMSVLNGWLLLVLPGLLPQAVGGCEAGKKGAVRIAHKCFTFNSYSRTLHMG